MIHYMIEPVILDGKRFYIDAQDIDNLRKRMIRDGYLDKDPKDYFIYVKSASWPGAPYNTIGRIYRNRNGEIFWHSGSNRHTRRVSTKTGALLNVNKYWAWY